MTTIIMEKCGIVLLYILGWICWVQAFFFAYCGCGNLDPKDPYLFVGEYLNMTCKLKEGVNQKINSSELYFTYNSDKEVPKNETYVVDDFSLKLIKLLSSMDDAGPYWCKLRKPVSGIYWVNSTTVELEYAPQFVTNFSCIIYDWEESMVCSWDLGIQYKNFININITLLMDGSYCPRMEYTKRLYNCTWTKSDGIRFDRNHLNFSINVTNKIRGVSKYTDFAISQIDIVKPSKVEYFVVKQVTSTCVTLEWRHPKGNRSKEFIITTTSKWNDIKINETENSNITICNLKPFTKYNFTIVTWPGKNTGYPSDVEINSTNTPTDIPEKSPEIIGTYFVENEDCLKDKRSISINWKELQEEYHNGPMIGYHISVTDSDGRQHLQYNINNTNQLSKSIKLQCDQEMIVSLKSWGQKGFSKLSSNVTIPKASYLTKLHITLIATGIVVFTVVIVIAVLICRKVPQFCKEVQKPYQIDTIVIPKANGSVQHQLSKDSGNESLSSDHSYSTIDNGQLTGNEQASKEVGTHNENNSELYNEKSSGHNLQNGKIIYDTGFLNDTNCIQNSVDTDSKLSQSTSDIKQQCLERLSWASIAISTESLSSSDEKIFINCEEDEDGYNDVVVDQDDEEMVSYVIHGNNDSDSNTTENTTYNPVSAGHSTLNSKGRVLIDSVKTEKTCTNI